MNNHIHPIFQTLLAPFAPKPKFTKTYCSQCGGEFGPGDSGYSHCDQHNDLPVYGVKPPAVSPYLMLPVRAPADVLLARLSPKPRWDIWAMPERLEPFHLEQTLTQLTNEHAALDCVAQVADNFDCVILHTDAEGNQSDVSNKFARDYAIDMARDGWDEEWMIRNTFLSCRLTNDEIYEICRSR